MKIGKYKSPSGEILQVIQVDEENKRVEVDYGTHQHWWGEDSYSNWEPLEEQPQEEAKEISEEPAATPKKKTVKKPAQKKSAKTKKK